MSKVNFRECPKCGDWWRHHSDACKRTWKTRKGWKFGWDLQVVSANFLDCGWGFAWDKLPAVLGNHYSSKKVAEKKLNEWVELAIQPSLREAKEAFEAYEKKQEFFIKLCDHLVAHGLKPKQNNTVMIERVTLWDFFGAPPKPRPPRSTPAQP